MDAATARELRSLLTGQRVLSLAVLVDGAPYIGLLAYAMAPDFSGVLVHASALARHTAGLRPGAPVAVLIHAPDTPNNDSLQIQRFSAQGTVKVPAPGSPEHEQAKAAYLSRHPQAEPMFGFGDFRLYQLAFSSGRFVPGFARALDVSADELRRLG